LLRMECRKLPYADKVLFRRKHKRQKQKRLWHPCTKFHEQGNCDKIIEQPSLLLKGIGNEGRDEIVKVSVCMTSQPKGK
jgi:hypothetical protein